MNWIFWLVLIVVLTIIEVATVNLLTIWFVISGIVALIVSLFTENIVVSSTVFVMLGVFLLFTTRSIFKRYLSPKDEKTNLDRIIGMTGIVTEEIKRNHIGEVRVDGKRWSAISTKTIKPGEEVIIEKIEGVKLVVRKESDE
ncbi:MAG: NfeD family protein [Bacilli bacterium]|nr:NfeD family protein [Bacilli bacterium]